MELRSAGEMRVTWVRRKWNNITKKGPSGETSLWQEGQGPGRQLMRFELWAWEEKQAYEVGRWQRTRPGRIPQRMVETSLNCFRWGQDTIKFFILKWYSEGVWAFQGGASGKEPTCQCRRSTRCGFNPWVRKIPWRRAWRPTPVFLLKGAW